MKSLAILSTLLMLGACSSQKESAPASETVSISIPSVQCSMCDDTITEALTASKGVEEAVVDLEAKTVVVTYAAETLTLSDIESIIANAGYTANDRPADPEAYEGLPACCKLPDTGDEPKALPGTESL